ncbi:1-deoxy-D-xylulose-5-phosphate reductoisomerase [Kiloniella laminariae]|uniref:1-deoxy-D-xylulose 5-phosphate reductoisomerase n=1 Tax=Kiloniella laminariae TaxID=454162 RepID=A0ABT4LLQ5_9PROT|nr:1-deoxy-D-xylulose-5-phosphate reductoisomerase [Kiloniella laminariae]MCZ4282028.1 1-deoxy-D-xylulose-5-phosphate reductoisomerase [Kiloniella laminariae]
MHPNNISAELKAVCSQSPRSISVMGSTGSIGTNTIDLIARNPDLFRVEALTANRNVDLLAKQAIALNAKMAVVADPESYESLKNTLAGTGIEVAAGPEGLLEAAERPSDLVMAAIVGFAGLAPTLAAIKRGATLLLANKEALVCAGDLMMAAAQQSKARILPVDSEHNAIFQVFDFERKSGIEHITLTASGGPFRLFSQDQMKHVTREEALAHPNWVMGEKISVDSASMMNKGLELIEAAYLFGLPENQIKVLIHPQSIIHSMVSYVDGSVLAQLGSPDMRTPIAYALAWPERIKTPVAPLDLARIGQLTFEEPDPERFPALDLARIALNEHKTVIFNAANEVAVEAFLSEKINFISIARFVAEAMGSFPGLEEASLVEIMDLDKEVRYWCYEALKTYLVN